MPLRFHVKSNFGAFKLPKNVILAILEVLNFDFSSKFEHFFKSQIYHYPNFRVSKIVKKAIFAIQILPNLISRKIGWPIKFHNVDLNFTFIEFVEHSAVWKLEKFPLILLWLKNTWISTLCSKCPLCQKCHLDNFAVCKLIFFF